MAVKFEQLMCVKWSDADFIYTEMPEVTQELGCRRCNDHYHKYTILKRFWSEDQNILELRSGLNSNWILEVYTIKMEASKIERPQHLSDTPIRTGINAPPLTVLCWLIAWTNIPPALTAIARQPIFNTLGKGLTKNTSQTGTGCLTPLESHVRSSR